VGSCRWGGGGGGAEAGLRGSSFWSIILWGFVLGGGGLGVGGVCGRGWVHLGGKGVFGLKKNFCCFFWFFFFLYFFGTKKKKLGFASGFR